MDKIKGIIAVFVGAASFGILSTFVKKAYQQNFSLGEVTGIQASLGALILWVIYLTFADRRKKIKHKDSPWLLIGCGLCTGAVSILYYQCVAMVPASIAIILLMQYIWIGALLELILFKTKPSKAQAICSLLIIVGTLLSTGIFEHDVDQFSLIGVVYGLLAATAYSLFILLNSKIGNDYPVLKKSALMITGALILIMTTLLPLSLLSWETLTGILPYGIPLALFGTVIPPLLFAYGMPKTGYSLGSILSAVELPVAVFLSYNILGEYVSPLQWLGVVFILLIISVINIRRNSNRQNNKLH